MKLKKKTINKRPFIIIGILCFLIVIASYLLQNKSVLISRTKAQPLPGINLIFIGDSVSSTRSDGYVVALKNKIIALGYDVNYIPAAKGGSTTNNLDEQLQDASLKVNSSRKTVVFVTSGGNDIFYSIQNISGKRRIIPISDENKVRKNILGILRKYPTYTFIVGTPYNPLKGMKNDVKAKCESENGISSNKLQSFVNLFVDQYYSIQLERASINPSQLSVVNLSSSLQGRDDLFEAKDCIHPNATGFQLITDLFYKAFTDVFSPSPSPQQ